MKVPFYILANKSSNYVYPDMYVVKKVHLSEYEKYKPCRMKYYETTVKYKETISKYYYKKIRET